jgi:hypothetical protein
LNSVSVSRQILDAAIRVSLGKQAKGRCRVAHESEQRESLEEVVRLLESVREGIAAMEKPDFDEGRVDGYVVTALSAARAALSIAGRRKEQVEKSQER